MHLVLRAQLLEQVSGSPPIVGEFDERGGTIGRSDSNTMALPDPERHVSRLQAEITFASGVFSLRNVGSANPILINNRTLAPGEVVALRHQDQLEIGNYSLQVALQSSPGLRGAHQPAVDARIVIGASAGEARTGPRATSPPRQAPPGALGAAAGDDPFVGLLVAGVSSDADPFADLLGPPSPAPPSSAASPPASRSPAPARLPDDFDPFADSGAASLPHAEAPGAASSPVSDALGPAAAVPSLDSVFGLPSANREGSTDPLEAFLAPPAAGPVGTHNSPFDLLAGGPAGQGGPAEPDHTPELHAAYIPPPVREPTPSRARLPVAAAAPAPPSPSNEDSLVALWHAFCEGAQLSPPPPARLTPELMRMVGATLRHAVEGTLQLSEARTTIKQELHVPVTVIRARGNNPLKFAPDAAAALTQMMQPPMRGFLAAPEAMQDAMVDLLGHSVGTIEGMRAALQGMLRRFEPAQLEAQLASGGMLDRLLPMNRRAKLWELYLLHYGRISEAAREDFHELFGKAFVMAYESQAKEVAAARRPER